MTCGCDKKYADFASLWKPDGSPAHVHWDGTTADGGPEGNTDYQATRKANELIAQGWKPRGW